MPYDPSRIETRKEGEGGQDDFDPFAGRQNEHATTDNETLTHLLKAALGTGILSMPIAFMYSGIILGVFATLLTAFICAHCSYILVKCGHILYYRTRRTAMTFTEVTEVSFLSGPKWARSLAPVAKFTCIFSLFLTYFGTCSVYTVIISRNFLQVLDHWLGYHVSLRVLIASLLIPCILLCWIPNLKWLAPVSFFSNIFMGLGLGITFYYLFQELPPIETRVYATFNTLPGFFAITIFAMEAIGVMMPLENNMATPRHFLGVFGILSQGMFAITIIYTLLGFIGYLRYGELTEESITLNLPVDEWPAQAVKILIGLAVFGTFGLQFYVCLEICWDSIKHKCTKRPVFANYVLRTVLVILIVILAIAVPTIAPFIGLIGAFCFSTLGLILPVVIELIVYYEIGFGTWNWILWKNIALAIFGFFALIFGTISSVKDIVSLYTNPGSSV